MPVAFHTRPRALISLHLAVLLFGGSGVIGKVVSSPPLVVTCVRSLIAAIVLWGVLGVARLDFSPLRAHRTFLTVSGVLLAAHWWCFFEAVQRSTVGLGLLTFASYPVFVCLLGWCLLGEPLTPTMSGACGAVVVGLVLLVPRWAFGAQILTPACFGLSSGLSFAILTLANRRLVRNVASLLLVMVQTGIAGLCLLPLAAQSIHLIPQHDYVWLALSGVLCTALAHACFTASLVRLPAATVGITTALEPVYGISLAWAFLGEAPSLRMVVGGAFILSGSLLVTLRRPFCP